ncbi:MAG: 5-(carboxyamino)imidazole ribonucleotide mutase [Deltaproteobacteria bacterium]|nr:5-(carboxyamino)imidazole ribonucleotide mutase [Deltaproteobacteria bacterium]
MADVAVIIGSDSDKEIMKKTLDMLEKFHISYEFTICSAHRMPQHTIQYAKTAKERGIKVIIAGAGGAAHLAGVIAANTTLPVISVPLANPPFNGLDALLSSVQMPSGVPVATVSVGDAGAKNAAILAAQILSLNDKELSIALEKFKERMEKEGKVIG